MQQTTTETIFVMVRFRGCFRFLVILLCICSDFSHRAHCWFLLRNKLIFKLNISSR